MVEIFHRTNKVVVINQFNLSGRGNRNRLQSIALFYVIAIVMDYFGKNLDVIDYIELAFKCGNSICDVTCCCLFSDVCVLAVHRVR